MQSILFHTGRSAVSCSRTHTHTHTHSVSFSSAAWRGHVARQSLKQIKKEREDAAVRIQSGTEMFVFVLRPGAFECRPLEFLTSRVWLEHAALFLEIFKREKRG